jgi:hydrophobic/amphiphilic exporter-1 (mainly G- bacteria), HAE1 family
MTISELCIKRPVFTTMLVMLPIVLGVFALSNLGLDLMPNVEFPIITVQTNRPGTGVEEMETSVTKVIEEALNTIAGIDEIRSTTREGRCFVTVQFVLSKDRDVAQQEVQSKVNTIIGRLPDDTDAPVITKMDFDAMPVIELVVTSPRNMRELTEIVDKRIKEDLSGIDGVGSVVMLGGRTRAINIVVDTAKLEAYGLAISDVEKALASQNVELPGGRVDQQYRELTLRTAGRIDKPSEFAEVIVANVGGQPIRIGDLGGMEVVRDSFEEPRSLIRRDGVNAVGIQVVKQSGENTVAVTDAVEDRVKRLEEQFAREGKGDIRIAVDRNQATFIKASLAEVRLHIMMGAMLVVLTIMAFLRSWRTTLIAAIAIPASLFAAFPVMWACGMTLNNITLIGLVLVIGIVVDDAIIITENIFRWMTEKKMSAMEAARQGTREITLAVMATTSSLVVIFLPIAFMSGMVGRFLRSFGITCAITVAASLLVSLTMTPMLCSRFMRPGGHSDSEGHGGVKGFGFYLRFVEQPYLHLLRWSMRHRLMVVLVTIVVVASVFPMPFGKWMSFGNAAMAEKLSGLNYPGLIGMAGYNFMPKDDESQFSVGIRTPAGWTLEKTDRMMRQIEERIRKWPEVTHISVSVGDTNADSGKGQGNVTRANFLVTLQPLGHRKPDYSQFDIMARARVLAKDYPDLRISVQQPRAAGGGRGSDLEFIVAGPDLDKLNEYANRMIARLRSLKGLADVDTTLLPRQTEMRLSVDRDRASDQGVTVEQVAASLKTLVGGSIVSNYRDSAVGEQYDVWLRAQGIDRKDAAAVANLGLRSSKGGLVRVGSVATVKEELGPSQIDRAQRTRKISITANLAGMSGDVAQREFYIAFDELNAPSDYRIFATGGAKAQAESNVAFAAAFGLALIFMYMILAAQFESFVQPITILLAAPLTIPFAILTQLMLGQPLTMYSVLGVFLLFGIVKKNGILQIDYTNVMRKALADDPQRVHEIFRKTEADLASGSSASSWDRWMAGLPEFKRLRLWAILEANRVRLRPILMTTIVLVTAMIPIALGKGPGAASRADMAKVIVGGQALSLLLTLLVTPVSYSLFDDLGHWVRGLWSRK